MAFNGSGVHNRVHDWTTDLTNTVPVTASRMDADSDDFSTALSLTICRDGQSTTTARIPFASGISCAAGSTSAVAYAQTNDANTGMYFLAADQWGLVAGGTATITSTATKVTMPVAVDFTGAAAPTSSDGAALGSATQMWSDLFLASGAVINFNNGDITITHVANVLLFGGASSGYGFDAFIAPSTDDTAALGSTALKWSDLFLASGGVINFNNGDVTITNGAANSLSFAGASSGYLFDAAISTSGNIVVNTNKFNVTASSGDTAIAGTLAVTGALTANATAGVAARNTVKAFGTVVNSALVAGSFNVTSITDNGSDHTITMTSALAGSAYSVILTGDKENGAINVFFQYGSRTTTTFIVYGGNSAGTLIEPDSYSFMVLENA